MLGSLGLAESRQALVRNAAARLEEASPEDVLRWASAHFRQRLAIAASMEDTVLIHLATRIQPGVPVLFVDTGYHFAQTLATRDVVARAFDVTVLTLHPEQTVAEQDAEFGPRLHERDPDLCCELRKVRPLDRALQPFDAWASGARRVESASRARLAVIEWDAKRSMVKLNPLARWSDEQVAAYIDEHDLPANPLLRAGYPSIGCAPCTRRVAPGEHPRSGRWAGSSKTECGLHV